MIQYQEMHLGLAVYDNNNIRFRILEIQVRRKPHSFRLLVWISVKVRYKKTLANCMTQKMITDDGLRMRKGPLLETCTSIQQESAY